MNDQQLRDWAQKLPRELDAARVSAEQGLKRIATMISNALIEGGLTIPTDEARSKHVH